MQTRVINTTKIALQLICKSIQVATGTATLTLKPNQIVGSLEIQMGGKNMTFSQRMQAIRQADC